MFHDPGSDLLAGEPRSLSEIRTRVTTTSQLEENTIVLPQRAHETTARRPLLTSIVERQGRQESACH